MTPTPRSQRLTWPFLTLLAFATALPSSAGPPAGPTLNEPAPAFSLGGSTGATLLSDQLGKVVLLDFWASWCLPCAQSFPWLDSLQRKLSHRGFTVLGVNVDKKRAKADAFLGKHPVGFPVLFDPQGVVAKAYALPGMPSTFLIDRQGRLRQTHTGFRPEDGKDLEASILRLLAEGDSNSTARGAK